jgi:hypothetical protein
VPQGRMPAGCWVVSAEVLPHTLVAKDPRITARFLAWLQG